jgi:hypothetical protein
MSDFLSRLAERQLGRTTGIEPRVASIFASRTDQRAFESIAGDVAAQGDPEEREEASSARFSRKPGKPLESDRESASVIVPLVRRNPSGLPEYPASVAAPIAKPESARVRYEPPTAEFARTPAGAPQPAARSVESDGQNTVPARLVSLESQAPDRAPNLPAPLVKQGAPESPRGRNESPAPPPRLSRQDQRSAPPPVAEEPPVYVTIGRIEVTAQTTPPSPKPSPAPRKKAMSLERYLEQRERRGR